MAKPAAKKVKKAHVSKAKKMDATKKADVPAK